MAEEIKIVVKQEMQGDALEKANQQADELKKKQTTGEPTRPAPRVIDATQPAPAAARPGQPAARINTNRQSGLLTPLPGTEPRPPKETPEEFARRALASRAAVAEREAAAETAALAQKKAQTEAEKAITREKAQQATLTRRIGGAALATGQQVANGVGDGGGLITAALNAPGGPLVKLAALAGAVTTTVLAMGAMERDKDESSQNNDSAARSGNARRRGIRAGLRGTSSEARTAGFAAEEEGAALRDQMAEIERKKQEKWYKPSTWRLGGLRKNAGDREEEENLAAQARAGDASVKDREQAREKFNTEEGGLRLQIQRSKAKRTIAGNREVLQAEAQIEHLETMRRVDAEGGTPEQVAEAGQLAVAETLRQRQLAAASGTVDARAGAGDIARGASLATMALPGMDSLKSAIDSQTEKFLGGMQTPPLKQWGDT